MGFENNIKSIVFSMAFPGPRMDVRPNWERLLKNTMLQSVQFIIKTKFFNLEKLQLLKDPVIRHKLAETTKKMIYS